MGEDGQQLYFRRSSPGKPGEVLSVTVNPDGTTTTPTVVLTGDYGDETTAYDVLPDGSFLMLTDEENAPANRSFEVVVNWAALRGLTTKR